MPTAVVLFNRDLRVHDHPALTAAVTGAIAVVPLFVFDDAILRSTFAAPNRLRFLLESLADLRAALRARGGDLVVRRGDPVARTIELATAVHADVIHATADVSTYAARRQAALDGAARAVGIEVRWHDAVAVVAPGKVLPTGGSDHFKVFTPYHRAWERMRRRPVLDAPERVILPAGVDPGELPTLAELTDDAAASPAVAPGGETAARAALDGFLGDGVARYEDGQNDLATDGTSRLSPYLHFGCLSASEVVQRAQRTPGAEPFVRQLCWRDFYHQVAAAFPGLRRADYRPRGDRWATDAAMLQAWQDGRTGLPLVDAGMRQLRHEGWMHNRARLLTASFLVKDLRIDWRVGAAYFEHWLVDGDVVQNAANWQWVAGTGNDTRPNRVFNPTRQFERFDPDGAYVRRWVPELEALSTKEIARLHSVGSGRRPNGYPPPIVDHELVAGAFLEARRGAIQERLPL